MLKKLQILLAGILLACATITVISGCKNANLVETESDEKSIVITSRQTVPASQKLLELTIAFTNFSNTPTKVDVYFSGQTNPAFSNVEVTNGKISIDLSGYATGSYTIYVKSGNVTSNSISFTITTNAGKITISYGDSTGTDNPTGTEFDASAVVHFKQTADGRNYEYTDKEIKNVPAGATLDSLEKSYTGFTAQGLFLEKQPDDSYVINIYYTRNIITVTLNANGGTIGGEETSVQKGLYGTAFPKAKDLSLSHEIKTFGGWNSSADGTGTSYDDVKGFNYEQDITLYTVWLDYYEVTAADVVSTINSLGSGEYTIKVTGTISSSDIASIKNALFTNTKRYIDLDLSQTSGLTKLNEEAFSREVGYNHEGVPLIALKLPQSVTEIGKYCFYNCKTLTTVNAPGVTKLDIGAFYVCEKLTDITLADELTSIGDLAFGYCYSITELTLNAITIGNNVVPGDKKLTTINIGPAVQTISNGAFQEVTSLSSFTVSNENPYFKVVDGLLYSADGTRLVKCPSKLSTTEITLSSNVTSMDKYAFAYCDNITKASLPNVTIISSNAFMCSKNLAEVVIPKAVKIQGMAFYRCENLSSITLPDSLTEIGMYAFAYDTKLNSIFIPVSVITMNSDVFNYWTETQTINCGATSKPSGWEDDWSRCSYSVDLKATINWGASR